MSMWRNTLELLKNGVDMENVQEGGNLQES